MIINIEQSNGTKSAQSKKCRMLGKVRLGLMHPKIAQAHMIHDIELGKVMTQTDIDKAVAGEKPTKGRSGGGVQVSVEI